MILRPFPQPITTLHRARRDQVSAKLDALAHRRQLLTSELHAPAQGHVRTHFVAVSLALVSFLEDLHNARVHAERVNGDAKHFAEQQEQASFHAIYACLHMQKLEDCVCRQTPFVAEVAVVHGDNALGHAIRLIAQLRAMNEDRRG